METELLWVRCPVCKKKVGFDVIALEEMLKKARVGRVGRVVHQLSTKKGPFYDRWLAAMEARGDQKRCKDCHWVDHLLPYIKGEHPRCWCKPRYPGQFACKFFKPREED